MSHELDLYQTGMIAQKKADEKNKCTFFKKACASGCEKAYCKAFFPEKSPLVMEDQKKICLSDDHKECLRYTDGLEFHAERIRNRKGCPFLSNSQCGHPDIWRCNGFVPPFVIDGKNLELLQACFGNEFSDCPNYIIGVKFREEANRIAREREAANKST